MHSELSVIHFRGTARPDPTAASGSVLRSTRGHGRPASPAMVAGRPTVIVAGAPNRHDGGQASTASWPARQTRTVLASDSRRSSIVIRSPSQPSRSVMKTLPMMPATVASLLSTA